MNCEQAGKRIAEKTGDGDLPIGVRIHLFRCPSCAAEAKRMGAAVRSMRRDFLPAAPDFSLAVMNAIRAIPKPKTDPVSFRDWAIVGAVILAALGLSPMTASFKWIKTAFGSGFTLPLNIVLGLLIAGYCALFIGTHLDEIAERVNLRHD